MIAILRVRFTSNTSGTTYWPDQLVDNWMQLLRDNSVANFWWLSSHALFDLNYILLPEVKIDASPPSNKERDALQTKVIAAATSEHHPTWADVDILLLLFEQRTGWWGGGTSEVPLEVPLINATKRVPVTVIDPVTPFDAACQELGHSFGLSHEIRADSQVGKTAADEYASPYSVMSAQFGNTGFDPEYLRPASNELPAGAPAVEGRFIGQSAQRIAGPLLTPAQMLQFPAFRDSPSAVHIGAYNAERPVLVRLYAVNHHLREPSPAPVVATFSSRGRTFTLELRRGMYGYDQGIGAGGTAPPAGVVVHSFNLDGSLRYDGVADLKLFSEMTDWASRRGDFALRIVGMHPEKEYVDVEIRPGGWSSFPIRGVLLLGRFRSQHELNPMSHDDMRNTLIVELTNHSNQKNYQAYDNDTLGGMGAVMVFLRETGIRDDAALRTMSSDDQRNVLIVELDAQTGAGRELQALSNIDLVLVGLGSNRLVRGRVPGLVSSWIRGVLLLGRFRSQHELNQMSHDDMRNTLIVELTNHSNQKNYQAYNDAQLEGAGAVMVAMRLMGIRDDAALRTMSSDDQRNVLIVELDAQTGLGASLQGLSNLELALIPLGVQRATQ